MNFWKWLLPREQVNQHFSRDQGIVLRFIESWHIIQRTKKPEVFSRRVDDLSKLWIRLFPISRRGEQYYESVVLSSINAYEANKPTNKVSDLLKEIMLNLDKYFDKPLYQLSIIESFSDEIQKYKDLYDAEGWDPENEKSRVMKQYHKIRDGLFEKSLLVDCYDPNSGFVDLIQQVETGMNLYDREPKTDAF